MVNTTALNNISQLNMTEKSLENTSNITQEIIFTANESSGGLYGLIILSGLFLFLFLLLSFRKGDFRRDFVQALIISSGTVSVLGFFMIIPGIVSNFQHVMWFVGLFALSSMFEYLARQ